MRLVSLVCATQCLIAQPLAAAFLNGVESFGGTTLDTTTWQFTAAENPPGTFSQNNALTVNKQTYTSDGTARLTTKTIVITPGQGVKVQAQFNQKTDAATAELYITNQVGLASELAVGIAAIDTRGWVAVRNSTGGASQANFINDTAQQPVGGTYTYLLEWLNQQTVRASVLAPNNSSLGSFTYNNLAFLPSELHISLRSQAASTTFDNVTIVPEPTALTGLLLGIARRRSRT